MVSSLELIILLLACSVGMVAILRNFKMPPMIAYFVVGLILGPSVAGVIVIGSLFGLSLSEGFIIGSAITMSSTAIVSKILMERLDLNTRHGKLSIGILLFQDLAVILVLVLIPSLSNPDAIDFRLSQI